MKFKIILTFVNAMILNSHYTYSQDLSGIWKGNSYQEDRIFYQEFKLLKVDSLTYSCTSTVKQKKEFGVMEAKCWFYDGSLYFSEQSILEDSSVINEWCLKKGKLLFTENENGVKLTGKWNGYCAPGTMTLTRAQKKFEPFNKAFYFKHDSFKIDSAYKSTLSKITNLLNEYPKTKIYIKGMTNDIGEINYNNTLSLERANTIKAILVKRGISSDRIIVFAMGEVDLLSGTSKQEQRKQNRRVDISIERIEK